MILTITNTKKHHGLSLIELMVAIAIGSLLMLGLTTTFQNSSQTQREMERTGRLIENGRYAIDLLTADIHHAGFFGHFYQSQAAPGAMPDPCLTTPLTSLQDAMAMPIQGYTTPVVATFSATNCGTGGYLTATNMKLGSDVFVIRRASTDIVGSPSVENPDTGRVYIMANPRTANLLLGNSGADVPTEQADNTAVSLYKYPSVAANTTPADTYEYMVHTYFIAPCSFGTGTTPAGECEASDDDIPTLKRLELSSVGGTATIEIVPLVEGVELMRVAYGIDTIPATINPATGYPGDGVPDSYVLTPTLAQWPLVVSMQIYLLMAATEESPAYTDAKQYIFPAPISLTTGPIADDGATTKIDESALKRHVYSTEVRPMNLASRRE